MITNTVCYSCPILTLVEHTFPNDSPRVSCKYDGIHVNIM